MCIISPISKSSLAPGRVIYKQALPQVGKLMGASFAQLYFSGAWMLPCLIRKSLDLELPSAAVRHSLALL